MELGTSSKKGYFEYSIKTGKDCPKQLNEGARAKLLSAKDDAGGICVVVWTCRTSRTGVHAWCNKSKLSKNLKKWVDDEFKRLRLSKEKVDIKHDADYKNGKCLKKKN